MQRTRVCIGDGTGPPTRAAISSILVLFASLSCVTVNWRLITPYPAVNVRSWWLPAVTTVELSCHFTAALPPPRQYSVVEEENSAPTRRLLKFTLPHRWLRLFGLAGRDRRPFSVPGGKDKKTALAYVALSITARTPKTDKNLDVLAKADPGTTRRKVAASSCHNRLHSTSQGLDLPQPEYAAG